MSGGWTCSAETKNSHLMMISIRTESMCTSQRYSPLYSFDRPGRQLFETREDVSVASHFQNFGHGAMMHDCRLEHTRETLRQFSRCNAAKGLSFKSLAAKAP